MFSRAHGIAITLLLVSCGARTGLRVPDAAVCRPGDFPLQRASAELMLVLDRSGSMAAALDGAEPSPESPSRWDLLRRALDVTLHRFEGTLPVGAKLFPRALNSTVGDIPPSIGCMLDDGVELGPRLGSANDVVDLLQYAEPRGGTPTARALQITRDFLASRARQNVSQYIVLATDGGPNCNSNPGTDALHCVCTSVPEDCSSNPERGIYSCLDDRRTLDTVAESVRRGIPIYVVGIDDPTRPDLGDVLDRMAVAGARPRDIDGERRYYDVRRPEDLAGALGAIQASIAACIFVSPYRPPSPEAITVTLDGVPLARDPDHHDGWDWRDAGSGTMELFGPACERAQAGGAVVAHVTCDDDGG